MTLVFEPPRSLLIIPAILVAGAIVVLLLTNRHPARKMLTLMVAIVLATVLLLRYRTAELTVDDTGISADTYGNPSIQWADIEQAAYIADIGASRYGAKPNLKSAFRILGYAKARYGWFDSAGDQQALFAVQRYDGDAVVVTTTNTIFVFGPSDARGLARAMARYVPVAGLDASE